MFIVFNKGKIISYIVALSTVIVLFVMAATLDTSNKTVETKSNVENINNTTNVLTNNIVKNE